MDTETGPNDKTNPQGSEGSGTAPVPFRVEVTRAPEGTAVVDLHGEVDMYNAVEFRETVAGLIEQGEQSIIIDATKVTFMDSTALGVYAGAERRLRPDGALYVACSHDTGRLFEMTGLDRVLTLVRTVDEAREAVQSAARR